MLEEAILGDQVMMLTEASYSESFDLLNEDNIAKLRAMPQKNIETNILIRVMKEKLGNVKKTNMTVSKSFSEKFDLILDRYHNRNDHMDVYEVFENSLSLKKSWKKPRRRGTARPHYEEKAFFDVLGADPGIKKLMEDDILIKIVKDLTKAVKENRTVDWDKKGKPKPKCALPLKKFCANTDTRQTRNQRLWRMYWNRRSCRLRICNGPDLSEKS